MFRAWLDGFFGAFLQLSGAGFIVYAAFPLYKSGYDLSAMGNAAWYNILVGAGLITFGSFLRYRANHTVWVANYSSESKQISLRDRWNRAMFQPLHQDDPDGQV